MPTFGEPLKGKILIPREASFKVDIEKSAISMLNGKEVVDVGKQVTYMVQN